MKIAYFKFEEWEKEYIKSSTLLGEDHEVIFFDHILNSEKLPEERDFEVLAVFVDSKVDKAVLDAFPNLKMVATRSTGFDHVDLSECEARGIVVANVPAYGQETVAEYAFALLLTLSRRTYEAYNKLRESGKFDPQGLRGFDLNGKTLGVIGTGKIGKNSIQIAKGFDMNVVAYDPYPDADFAKKMGFQYKELDEVLAEADVVTIHVPYMEATHHMLNSETIPKMKKGAVLVNTSRGPIVETAALVKALRDGHLRGAALDVVEEEPLIKDELNFLVDGKGDLEQLRTALADHVLIDMDNVIVSPHNAFNTIEALQRIVETTLKNINAVATGSPENVVKAKK